MKKTKKILAVLLAAILLVGTGVGNNSLLTVNAEVVLDENTVATVGTGELMVQYTADNLNEAMCASTVNNPVVIVKDFETSKSYSVLNEDEATGVYINLNGHTVSRTQEGSGIFLELQKDIPVSIYNGNVSLHYSYYDDGGIISVYNTSYTNSVEIKNCVLENSDSENKGVAIVLGKGNVILDNVSIYGRVDRDRNPMIHMDNFPSFTIRNNVNIVGSGPSYMYALTIEENAILKVGILYYDSVSPVNMTFVNNGTLYTGRLFFDSHRGSVNATNNGTIVLQKTSEDAESEGNLTNNGIIYMSSNYVDSNPKLNILSESTGNIFTIATDPIEVTNLSAPVAGSTLDKDVTVASSYLASVKYFDGDTEITDTNAKYNKTYTAKINVKPNGQNYGIPMGSTGTINGEEPTSTTVNNDGSMTLTYTFSTTAKAKLMSITAPTGITVANGTAYADMGLPANVAIVTEGNTETTAAVVWDTTTPASGSYNPAVLTEQSVTLNGTVTCPTNIDANGVTLTTTITVTISAAGIVGTPIFTPAAGTYTKNQSVALVSSTDGATIYYTTDGTTPTTNSNVYSGAISVTGTAGKSISTTIKAIAVKSGMQTSSVASATYVIELPAPAPSTYAVTVNNGTGDGSYEAGKTITITADAAPTITTQPVNVIVIEGNSAIFSVVATGTPTLTYQWQVDRNTGSFVNIDGATSASYTTSATSVSNSGYQYRCVVTNDVSSVLSNEATLTVTEAPVTTYTITVNTDGNGSALANITTAAHGTKVTLTAIPNSEYQFKEWQVVSGDITITDNAFTMPAGNVTVKAVFEKKASDNNDDKTGPSIVGDDGTTGWDAIKNKTENAATGSTITVDMNGTTKVPGNVIDSIKGKDVNVVFDLGNGIKWTVNGKSVTKDDIGEIDFGVTTGTSTIPVDVVNEVTGERYSIQISLAYNGEFGFTATLSINMDAKNAGYYANLYYYNKSTGKLEFMNAGKIDKNGNVELTFTHASDYTIVVSDKAMNETETTAETPTSETSSTTPGTTTAETPTSETPSTTPTETDSPKSGDTSPILLWVLVLISLGIGVTTVASKKRKRETK